MNRRGFLKSLLGTAVAAAILPRLEALAVPPRWWTNAVTLTRGDVFTISGVYAVNPVTKSVTSRLQQFVITADVVSDDEAPAICPRLITEGPYQTVSNLPSDDAQLNPLWVGREVPIGKVEWIEG